MAKNGMTEAQRYDWATGILRREQGRGIRGTVTFFLENGVITRTRIEEMEEPAESKSSLPDAAFTNRRPQ